MSAVFVVYILYMAAMCMSIVIQPPVPILPSLPTPPYYQYYEWPHPIIDVGIALVSQSVSITIEDRYAFINYSFYFINKNSNSSSQLDYEISLQPNTFISYFSAELNGVVFRGETKERLQASNEYNNAVEAGLNAVLVSQDHDANVFNIKTNIEKGGYANLNIVAETFMLRRFGYYELSLLTTNIYTSSIIDSEFTNTDITINLYDESPIPYTDVDVITPVNANYNINQISSNQYKIDISLPKSLTIRQELILLRYRTETTNNMNQLLYDDNSMTFMHIFSYDDQVSAILPRRVVFVLDRSGSMGINKWQSAVSATIGAIQHLKVGIDKMNIILFDHVSIFYSTSIVSVTANIITDAINWINGYNSRGSTNIYRAVVDAIHLIKYDTSTVLYNSEFEYVNQIILITDGQPTAGITDPVQIQNGLYDVNNQQLQAAPASIFCLGIGDDYGDGWVKNLNYPLLRSIATQNEGFDAMIRASQTETILAQYYDILESPVLSYIRLDYISYVTNIENINFFGNNIHNLTQNTYRGLYAGTDIVVAGKLSVASKGIIISLSGRSNGGNLISDTFPIEFNGNNNIIIDRIWAYLRLKMCRSLLDNPRLPSLNAVLFTILESGALNLALKYELVTPWTSMIVVDENNNTNKISEPSGRSVQTPDAVGIPGGPVFNLPAAPWTRVPPRVSPGGITTQTSPQPPQLPPPIVILDCNVYINDESKCVQQKLSNGDQKCAFNALNGDCYLIVYTPLQQQPVAPNAAASGPENNINDALDIQVNHDKDKDNLFIFIYVTYGVLICVLSAMVVGVLCYYYRKKNRNKEMEVLTEINNV